MSFVLALLLMASLVSVVAGVIDFRTGHIPNWLTLGTLALALVLRVTQGAAISGFRGAGTELATSIIGLLLCAVVPCILYQLAGMGGGDLKLLAALGALCGPVIGLQAQLYSFVALLLFAAAQLTYHGRLLRTLGNAFGLLVNPLLPKVRRSTLAPELMTSLRFGPAVAAGVLATTLANWRIG